MINGKLLVKTKIATSVLCIDDLVVFTLWVLNEEVQVFPVEPTWKSN